MLYDAIDSAYLAVPDLDAAGRPYERLGLRPSPAHAGRRTLHVGGPGNLFSIHFVAEVAESPLAEPLCFALAADRGRSQSPSALTT